MMKNVLTGIVLLLLLSDGPANGQEVIEVENDKEEVIVNPHVYVFNDQSARIGNIARVMAAPDSAFAKIYYAPGYAHYLITSNHSSNPCWPVIG